MFPIRAATIGLEYIFSIAEEKSLKSDLSVKMTVASDREITNLRKGGAYKSSCAIDDGLHRSTTVARQHRLPGCHGFQRYNAEVFIYWGVQDT